MARHLHLIAVMLKQIAACLLVCCSAFAQSGPPNDQRVMELVRLGVSQTEILRMIATAPEVDFDLRPVSTDAMMKIGVSEEIIKAMAARLNGTSVAPTVPTPAIQRTMAASTRSIPALEVGAYIYQNGGWVEMMPEVVNWKTGGVLKSISTLGIVKQDVNGRLRGGTSKLRVTNPVRLLVYCREGTQVTEYQLIRLRTHRHAREFRTVTGGIFHVSGGSNRDDLPFDSQHIAPRTWTIPLKNLKPGEYGLLPPGAIEARSASAQLGKMYTFTVTE